MTNELYRLCETHSWSLVEERCKDAPEEAVPCEFSMRGDRTTILAMAVRNGAPLTTIQSIVKTNPSQLSVVHRLRGTIVHEALVQGASLKVTAFLLQVAKDSCSNELFGNADQLGRTILHCVILHAIRAHACPGDTWNVFQSVIKSSPQAVCRMDCDGNTPLLLLLLHQDTHRQNCPMHEAQIHRMVKLMLCVCPDAAMICRKVQRHWPTPNTADGTVGDGVPTPLTYAMLYGRSEATIGLLLDASKKVGSDACMTLVSGYHEVPLHLAVSLRSSISLLKRLVEESPQATHVPDIHNLKPLDWLWIRHTLDWCSNTLNPVSPSTRRYLQNDFAQLHERASIEETTQVSTVLNETLWQRLRIMLPASAVSRCNEPLYKQGEPWPMLHAVCFTSCPIAVVRLVLRRVGTKELVKRDLRRGRLPLHYAATRGGYSARIPVGAMSEGIQDICEPPVVKYILASCKRAARVVDANNQLPLHIAITTSTLSGTSNLESIQALLSDYPESLDRRDGKTKLFPWMQAAVGNNSCVDTIFSLLMHNPTLVGSAIPHL